MGMDFRGKGYVRYVRIGKRTVKDGECAAVWDQRGRHTEVRGPEFKRLWWSTIRFLECHVAETQQYLRVKHIDGSIEHLRGPTALHENPVHHVGVSVERAIKLENDACHLLVHRPADASKDDPFPKGVSNASQLVVTGPKIFYPEPGDVLRIFQWTANGAGALAHEGLVVMSKTSVQRTLQIVVRSGDDHSITIGVTLRACLLGLDEVLAVVDPIAECDAAAQVAVAEALGAVHLAEHGSAVHSHVREALVSEALRARLDKALRQRAACELVTLAVDSVQPSPEFERLLRKEDALGAVKLTEQLADAALDAAFARQQREQQMEAGEQAHILKLLAERMAASQGSQDDEAKRTIDFLKDLSSMNVDLSKVLCRPGRPVGDADIAALRALRALDNRAAAAPNTKKAVGWW